MSNLHTCKKCSWVAFGVSREYAEDEVKRFNEYFNTLSKKDQDDFYGGKGSSIKIYENCFFCGGPYTNFRPYNEKTDPYIFGHTLNPIIVEGL